MSYSINTDARVIDAVSKRDAITRRLAVARTEHSGLMVRRAQLGNARHEAFVAAELSDGLDPAVSPLDAEIADVEAGIQRAQEQIVAMNDALMRQEAVVKRTNTAARNDLREVVNAKARAVIGAQRSHFREIQRLQSDLLECHSANVMAIDPVFFQGTALVPAWLRGADGFCREEVAPIAPVTLEAVSVEG